MKKVITYGTFDLFHVGHVNLLRRAKARGDYLIVACSTDKFNLLAKNKQSVYSFEDRKKILESCKYVDKVIPEDSWSQKLTDVREYKISVFVIGDDWKGKFDYLKPKCKVVYLSRTKNISSSKIKEVLK